MSTSTDEDIVVLENLEWLPACERDLHGVFGPVDAPAEWILTVIASCPSHPRKTTKLVCDPCLQARITVHMLICTAENCTAMYPNDLTRISYVRISGDQ
jgi:hypothetical protein